MIQNRILVVFWQIERPFWKNNSRWKFKHAALIWTRQEATKKFVRLVNNKLITNNFYEIDQISNSATQFQSNILQEKGNAVSSFFKHLLQKISILFLVESNWKLTA